MLSIVFYPIFILICECAFKNYFPVYIILYGISKYGVKHFVFVLVWFLSTMVAVIKLEINIHIPIKKIKPEKNCYL